MSKLKDFMEQWFPKTKEWDNVAKFILESGVELVEEQNQKWLPGYTNISMSSKPHHKDEYIRYMEESMFQLHDLLHNIFTINVLCDEEEYVKRQIFGELFVFYLTEYIIPFEGRYDAFFNHKQYINDRGCFKLMIEVLKYHKGTNVITFMWDCFIEDKVKMNLPETVKDNFKKYSKMFKEDLENSRKNYKFVKGLNIERDCCIVGTSSRNHIDFFEAVKSGAIKNIKREFNVKLPELWN